MATWHSEDLQQLTGAPGKSEGQTTGYVWNSDPSGSSQHVVYVASDNHVHEVYTAKGWDGWGHVDLSKEAGAPRALGGSTPFGYAWDRDRSQHVVYVGEDLHVHELFFGAGGPWRHFDLTKEAGTSSLVKAGGTVFAYVWDRDPAGSSQHVIYVGGDLKVHELYTRGGGWTHHNLTDAGRGHLVASVSAFGYVWNGDAAGSTQHVLYQSSLDRHIHELVFGANDRTWRDYNLGAAAGGPTALLGGTPFGYAWELDGSQHVVYQGADPLHVHELWFSNQTRSWHHSDLTSTTGIKPTHSVPFGYTFQPSPDLHSQSVVIHMLESLMVSSNPVTTRLYQLTFNSQERIWRAVDIQLSDGQIQPASPPMGWGWEETGSQHVIYDLDHRWSTDVM
jgi:hypothetical protein